MTPDASPYDALRARMAFLRDSYFGGHAYRSPALTTLSSAKIYETRENRETGDLTTSVVRELSSYLVPHGAESDRAFEARHALAVYVNVVAPIVDAYAEACTSQVQRDPGELEPFLDDVDGRGSSWGEHVEEVARWAAAYGLLATVVDAPRGEAPASRAEEIARGLGPRAVIVPPPAWAWVDVDADGRLEEFAYVDDAFADATGGALHQTVRVRVWNRAGWEVREGTVATGLGKGLGEQRGSFGKVLESGPLPAALKGELPVVFTFYKRVSDSRLPLGQSLVDDAADVARLIYNSLSWASEVHRKAGFPTLAIPLGSTGGQMDPQTRRTLGPDRALPFDGATGAPQWIQPSSESTKELREHCLFLFQLALRTAGLELAADASAQVQSGEALRIRSRDFESRAKRFARNLQRYEEKTLALMAKLAGVAAAPTVTYPNRFTLPDPSEDLANALTVLKDMPVEIGATAKTAAVRKALDAALCLSDDELSKALDEVREVLAQDAEDFAEARAAEKAARAQKTAPEHPDEPMMDEESEDDGAPHRAPEAGSAAPDARPARAPGRRRGPR